MPFGNFRNYMLGKRRIMQRLTPEQKRLITIDGLGNNPIPHIANYLRTFAERVIRRK